MFTNLIRAILGGLGIIKKNAAFTTANNAEFLQSLEPCTVILTANIKPNFIQGGIQGATNSLWQHALIYVGKSAGQKTRILYPELLNNKKIPAESQYHEIIEAQAAGIKISTLNLSDDIQIVGYMKIINEADKLTILKRAYDSVGKMYDFLETLGHVIPMSDSKKSFNCSGAVQHYWNPITKISDKNKPSPADLNTYLRNKITWNQTKYNF
jgi:hypothetical protein